MAIIAIAAWKLVRLTDGADWRAWAISAVVFTVTALTGQEPVYLVIGAGLLMIILDARPRLPRRKPPSRGTDQAPSVHGAVPLAWAALGAAASGGVLVSLGLFFLKTGALAAATPASAATTWCWRAPPGRAATPA
jgi:chromate transporter